MGFLEGVTPAEDGGPWRVPDQPCSLSLSPFKLILQHLEMSALQHRGPSGPLPGTCGQ